MSGAGGPTLVDARGLACPWPAIRFARALREGAPVRLRIDTPLAERECRAVAEAQGWSFERAGADGFDAAPMVRVA